MKEFTVSIHVSVICRKRQEYMMEADDDVSFQYILRFARIGDVENHRIYNVLKSRPGGGLLREDASG